jgi:hypothetical protein
MTQRLSMVNSAAWPSSLNRHISTVVPPGVHTGGIRVIAGASGKLSIRPGVLVTADGLRVEETSNLANVLDVPAPPETGVRYDAIVCTAVSTDTDPPSAATYSIVQGTPGAEPALPSPGTNGYLLGYGVRIAGSASANYDHLVGAGRGPIYPNQSEFTLGDGVSYCGDFNGLAQLGAAVGALPARGGLLRVRGNAFEVLRSRVIFKPGMQIIGERVEQTTADLPESPDSDPLKPLWTTTTAGMLRGDELCPGLVLRGLRLNNPDGFALRVDGLVDGVIDVQLVGGLGIDHAGSTRCEFAIDCHGGAQFRVNGPLDDAKIVRMTGTNNPLSGTELKNATVSRLRSPVRGFSHPGAFPGNVADIGSGDLATTTSAYALTCRNAVFSSNKTCRGVMLRGKGSMKIDGAAGLTVVNTQDSRSWIEIGELTTPANSGGAGGAGTAAIGAISGKQFGASATASPAPVRADLIDLIPGLARYGLSSLLAGGGRGGAGANGAGGYGGGVFVAEFDGPIDVVGGINASGSAGTSGTGGGSSGGGGGGGGAIVLISHTAIRVQGSLTAEGGDGGNGLTNESGPGGGGGGGGGGGLILLIAPVVDTALAGGLSVDAGAKGTGAVGSTGNGTDGGETNSGRIITIETDVGAFFGR